jgi:hypothetical protein
VRLRGRSRVQHSRSIAIVAAVIQAVLIANDAD